MLVASAALQAARPKYGMMVQQLFGCCCSARGAVASQNGIESAIEACWEAGRVTGKGVAAIKLEAQRTYRRSQIHASTHVTHDKQTHELHIPRSESQTCFLRTTNRLAQEAIPWGLSFLRRADPMDQIF